MKVLTWLFSCFTSLSALAQTTSGELSFTLGPNDEYINVMGNAKPAMPAFPALTKKPGKICGYVKDAKGQPVEGAYLGLRSSAVGGYYSAAFGETDAKGYYEIAIPWGAAHFYAAGYTIDYGEGRAALGLLAADGKKGSFPSTDGAVKNFVLWSFGIADRDRMSEEPWYPNAYLGASIRISYELGKPGDMWATRGSLPEDAEFEITLTPEGEMLDAGPAKTFIIRKKVGNLNFNINNIPVGKYTIAAKLKNGKPLKMKVSGYNKQPLFGLKPAEAVGSASLYFTPSGAKASSAIADRGNWDPVSIKLELP